MDQVELKVTAVRCIHRAAALPFELSDASRSEAQVKAAEVRPPAVPQAACFAAHQLQRQPKAHAEFAVAMRRQRARSSPR